MSSKSNRTFSTCEVCGIRTRRCNGEKRSFMAKFPLDAERCRQWVKLVGKEDLAYLPIEKLNGIKHVCGKHFRPKDFNKKKTRLKKKAIPSLHLTAPSLSDDILVEFPLRLATSSPLECEVDHCYNVRTVSEKKIFPSPVVPSAPVCFSPDLNSGSETDYDAYETEIKQQNDLLEKLIEEAKKTSIAQESAEFKRHGSKECLNKLTPFSHKDPIIATEEPKESYVTHPEQLDNSSNRPKGLSEDYIKYITIDNTQTLAKHTTQELQNDNAIGYKEQISKLLNIQDKLQNRIKELETKIEKDEDDFVTKVKDMFSHVFTSNQVDMIMGKKIQAWWDEAEYIKAFDLHNLSKDAYLYVRDTLNYPLPAITSLEQWAAQFSAQIPDGVDNEENKRPRSKRTNLTLYTITKQYNKKKKKDYIDCISEENELPLDDNETIDDHSISDITLKPRKNDSDTDEDSDTTKQSDRDGNTKVGNISFVNVDQNYEDDNVMYEDIDYLDEDIINGEDDVDVMSSVDSEGDDYDEKMNEQSDRSNEELVIDDLSEHEVIDNPNRVRFVKDKG